MRMYLALILALVVVECTGHAPPPEVPAARTPVPVQSVVRMTGLTADGRGFGCTAIAIEPDVFVTAGHCTLLLGSEGWVADKPIQAAWYHQDLDTHLALVSTDKSVPHDVGLVRAQGSGVPPAPVSDSLPNQFSWGWDAGYGCDKALHVNLGLYLGLSDAGNMVWAARSCHGDSGGGVFSQDGSVVGVISRTTDDESTTVACPIGDAADGLASYEGWALIP